MTDGVLGKWTISWIGETLVQAVIILMIFLVSNNNHMAFGSAAIRLRQQQLQQQQQLLLASYSTTTTTTNGMPATTSSAEIEPYTISTSPLSVTATTTTARSIARSTSQVPSRNLNRNRYQSYQYQFQSQSSIRDRPKYQYTNYANRTNSSPNSKYSGYQSLNQPSLFQTSTRRPSFLNSYPGRIGPGGAKTVGRKSVLCCTDQLFKATCAHFKHCFWYNNPGRKCFSKIRGKC